MLSEAYQRVATLQLGSNCYSYIVIFAALSSATQKCERAFTVKNRFWTLSRKMTRFLFSRKGFCALGLELGFGLSSLFLRVGTAHIVQFFLGFVQFLFLNLCSKIFEQLLKN